MYLFCLQEGIRKASGVHSEFDAMLAYVLTP
jgi:hypothetical protein